MADQQTADLPEGTDTMIEGAANSGAIATEPLTADEDDDEMLTIDGAARGDSLPSASRSGREQLAGQAGEKARGLVTQGLERSAEALANVSKMVGDTADGIDDRLGEEYGDYARRAAGAIENVANTHRGKGPRRTDRGYPQFRPQQPRHRPCRRGSGRLRRCPPRQERHRKRTRTTRIDAQTGRSRPATARAPRR